MSILLHIFAIIRRISVTTSVNPDEEILYLGDAIEFKTIYFSFGSKGGEIDESSVRAGSKDVISLAHTLHAVAQSALCAAVSGARITRERTARIGATPSLTRRSNAGWA